MSSSSSAERDICLNVAIRSEQDELYKSFGAVVFSRVWIRLFVPIGCYSCKRNHDKSAFGFEFVNCVQW